MMIMDLTTTNIYDMIPYPGHALAQAHPDRLATLATMFGRCVPKVETCRILGLGCGDGLNSIATALNLPNANCIGIDLAAAGIEKGIAIIQQPGLKNVASSSDGVYEISDKLGTGIGLTEYIDNLKKVENGDNSPSKKFCYSR